jgi:hypothetical protein
MVLPVFVGCKKTNAMESRSEGVAIDRRLIFPQKIVKILDSFPYRYATQYVTNEDMYLLFVVDAPYRGLPIMNVYCYEKVEVDKWILRCNIPINILSTVSRENIVSNGVEYFMPSYTKRERVVDVQFNGITIFSVNSIKGIYQNLLNSTRQP